MADNMMLNEPWSLSKSQLEQMALDEADAGQANTLGLILWLDSAYSDELIGRAVNHIIEHEQALRLRLKRGADGYVQYEQPYIAVRGLSSPFPAEAFKAPLNCGGAVPLRGREDDSPVGAAHQSSAPEKGLKISSPVEAFIERCEAEMATFTWAFDAPLYYFRIIRLSTPQGERAGLLAFFHHVIIDGAGAGIFSHMLTRYCALLAQGLALPRRAHRFTDAGVRDTAQADYAFWRGQLKQYPPQLSKIKPDSEVPSGPRKGQAQPQFSDGLSASAGNDLDSHLTIKGRRLKKALPLEEGRGLNAYCQAEGISPAVLFQAALVIYLRGLRPDLARFNFGSMISNRVGPKQKRMLGNFALELLHSVPAAAGDSVRALYAAVKSAAVRSYRHAQCSYEDILELAREMYPGLESLRDVLFSYLPPAVEEGRAFDLYWLANYCPETSLEFTVFNLIDKDEFILIFDYRKDVFSPQEAERLMEALLLIVRAVRQNPLARLQDVPGAPGARGK